MNSFIRKLLPWFIYPSTIGTGIALHVFMLAADFSILLSTYVPVLLTAMIVSLIEYCAPHKDSWRPNAGEVKEDLLFMTFVQMLLPKVLAFALVISIVEPLQSSGWVAHGLWPHQLSVVTQVLLMMGVAELFRYWLHRAAHRFPLLWRFHSIHHSPDRLYWLNVGRFHPLEKALQFFFDSLPFILIGVNEYVIAGYFVFYAMNGFFQHSNINLRFGYLNYLISTAELHRWHHSQEPAESNKNFGNNIIVWDLIFGTWFLPKGRKVGHLGLTVANYPKSFLMQLVSPFTKGYNARNPDNVENRRPRESFIKSTIFRIVLFVIHVWHWLPMKRASNTPRKAQMTVLNKILLQNRNTRFGHDHAFGDINCLEDYRLQVPIQTYESLRPHIEEQERTRTPILTSELPQMYARTSGTTGSTKDIPVLESTLNKYRSQQRLFTYLQHQACPDAFVGKGLGIVSPAVEGHLDSGTPYGSVSGHVYKTMPRLVRDNYLIPSELFEVADYDLKYQLILRIALAERDITFLGGANPTSFLRLLEVFNENKLALINSIETGIYEPLERLSGTTKNKIKARIIQDKPRAAELRALLNKEEITYADLWPNIRLITMWTEGSCGIATDRLRNKLPPTTKIQELGFVSTEFRGTLTVDGHEGGLPVLSDHFFEFVECDKWEQGSRRTQTLNELEVGMKYYVIVTTDNGLYRYFINDIVKVTGMFNKTPLLKFVQKGKGVTNITGEKLYEDHVIQAVKQAERKLGFTCTFFMMLANEVDQNYELFIETAEKRIKSLKQTIDENLSNLNIEYYAKRCSGRLHPLRVFPLRPGVFEAYKRFCIQEGQREGQFKTVLLQNKKDAKFDFGLYIDPNGASDRNATC